MIPYLDRAGHSVAMRYRWSLAKTEASDRRFTWRSGDKAQLYGLHLLDRWRKTGPSALLLVEGESDAHTATLAGYPTVGVPGASCWRDEWSAYLDKFARILLVQEPDQAGAGLAEKLLASPLRDRLSIVSLAPYKDVSELWLADPRLVPFRRALGKALKGAVPAAEIVERERRQRSEAAWRKCRRLARRPDLLRSFLHDLEQLGVVGEPRAAMLVFLVVASRLLPRPVSAVLKGPSAAGKSWVTDNVLKFFPDSAYYRLSGMSERFLVYDPEPLAHRIVYIAEAAGLEGDVASYLVRTLLSEGRLIWGTVDKTLGGTLAGRRIEKEGPTGVLITTTRLRLHPENETRLLSIPVSDTREQTRNVFRALANGHAPEPDFAPWHALAEWLETGERRVEIPFAGALAEKISPAAVRLRRDFGTLLALIRSHALLHRASRKVDHEGRVVAELADYEAVCRLTADLFSEGVERSVSPAVRGTVEAVRRLLAQKESAQPVGFWATVTAGELAEALRIDKGAVSRRVAAAVRLEYLVNEEERRGRSARLRLGPTALPEEEGILPGVDVLTAKPGGSKTLSSRKRRPRKPRAGSRRRRGGRSPAPFARRGARPGLTP